MFFSELHVKNYELAVRFKYGEPVAVLKQGHYRFWKSRNYSYEIYNKANIFFEVNPLQPIYKDPLLAEYLEVLELGEMERALVWKNGRLLKILGAGTHAYWKNSDPIEVEVFRIDDLELKHEHMRPIETHKDMDNFLNVFKVDEEALGLLFVNGELERVLETGRYLFWKDATRIQLRIVERKAVFPVDEFKNAHKNPLLASYLDVHDLAESERALVWQSGRLLTVIGPGSHAFWKGPEAIVTEVFNINDFELKHKQNHAIESHKEASKYLTAAQVGPGTEGLLFVDGEFQRKAAPGRYLFWKGGVKVEMLHIDPREQNMDVTGQEIMTADKVSLRMNLSATYRVTDSLLAVSEVTDHISALYNDAQLVLRKAVSTYNLDSLLSDKALLNEDLLKDLGERAAHYGVGVVSVGLKDIILPGDMKQLLNQVTEAQKAAEANLIKRREETAAARSQANTARLLVQNPELMRLKELEVMQEIFSNSKNTFIIGGNLNEELRNLLAG